MASGRHYATLRYHGQRVWASSWQQRGEQRPVEREDLTDQQQRQGLLVGCVCQCLGCGVALGVGDGPQSRGPCRRRSLGWDGMDHGCLDWISWMGIMVHTPYSSARCLGCLALGWMANSVTSYETKGSRNRYRYRYVRPYHTIPILRTKYTGIQSSKYLFF